MTNNKRYFLKMIKLFRSYQKSIEEVADLIDVEDPDKSPLVPFDDLIDLFAKGLGYNEEIKFAIYQLIWNGAVEIECKDMLDNALKIWVSDEEYYDIFIDGRLN